MQLEMIRPGLLSRVEQPLDLAGLAVDAREVRPLEQIAPLARETEVRYVIAPAVLAGYDVLDVVGELDVVLMDQAIFAAASGTSPDGCAGGRIHQLVPLASR